MDYRNNGRHGLTLRIDFAGLALLTRSVYALFPKSNHDNNVTAFLKQFQPKEYRQRFLVKYGQKHLPVETADIAFFFVDDRVICFRTKDNKKYLVDYTMDEIEQQVDPKRFFRVNRSFLIAVDSIGQLHDYVNSRVVLELHPGSSREVIVSRDKVHDFKKWVGR